MRIAMWSGPRNLSTAMMYSFGARPDCAVVDEPFYAAYLAATGLDHPMRSQILQSQSNDPAEVAAQISGAVPEGRAHFYQKHMAHHMLPGFPLEWMRGMRHVFLIRHPARVVASYDVKRDALTLDDLGFWQQKRLYDAALSLNLAPIVIDSFDIRCNPEAVLSRLCVALDLPFDAAMLHWPKGGHPADGVWAAHWYDAVHRSSGFAGAEGALSDLDGEKAALAEAALPYYRALEAAKL